MMPAATPSQIADRIARRVHDHAGIAQFLEHRSAYAKTPPTVAGENPAPRSNSVTTWWLIASAISLALVAVGIGLAVHLSP
jgi:hypothetical protein